MSAGVRWFGVANAAQLRRAAALRICEAAASAIAARGRFLIVLSGGETPRGVYELLRNADSDWTRWHVYFGDERVLPAQDADRNSTMATDAWLRYVPIPVRQIHEIRAELGAEAAAAAYIEKLCDIGEFDLVLLGLGEDGHIASLFPGSRGLATSAPDVVAIDGAPKPPPHRISLSAARLSRTRELLFLISGEAKRDAVWRWRTGGDPVPASYLCAAAGIDVLIEQTLLTPPAPNA